MSYCRFENTFMDLKDCYNALVEKSPDEISERERKYVIELIVLCRTIGEDFAFTSYKEKEEY